MKGTRSKGIVLVSVITVVIVISMLTAVLLKRGQVGLYQSAFYRDGVRARQAARGGVNHLTTLLSQDHDFSDEVEVELGSSKYLVTFDESQDDYSVNNLDNSGAATIPNSLGREVAPRTADLIVVGTSGSRRVAVHVIFRKTLGDGRGVAAGGRVVLTGDVKVDGVKSLVPPVGQAQPDPAPGGILSKYRSTGPSDPAISWDDNSGLSAFTLSDLSRLETAPAETGGQGLSGNLQSLFSDQSIPDGAADSIPDIDVSSIVSAGMSAETLEPSGVSLHGYVYVNEERSVHHDLTVNGSLSLVGGTLYVNGDLIVNGDIEGTGTVYASGDIRVRGGSALVVTDRDSGAAILAGGNVDLVGLDASGYLRSLSQAYGFEPAVDRLETLFSGYQSAASSTDFLDIAEDFGKSDAGNPSLDSLAPRPWISPVPGPDGTHSYGRSNGAANRLTLDLKNHHLNLSTDRRARKVLKALEQVQYHFRDGHRTIQHNGEHFTNSYALLVYEYILGEDYRLTEVGGSTPLGDYFFQDTPNLMFNIAWDDVSQEAKYWTHDHLGAGQEDYHRQRRNVFVAHNPLNEGWLGHSSFQGMIYARGNIRADGNFKVIGAVRSLGDVTLNNGATLIYNEEYRDLMGAQLPLGLVHYEEL